MAVLCACPWGLGAVGLCVWVSAVLLISHEQLAFTTLSTEHYSMADDDHGGARSSGGGTTTPTRRLYRRPRPVSTQEASDPELLYGSASGGLGMHRQQRGGRRRQREGRAGDEYDEDEEEEEEVGDVEWLLGTTRGPPISAEIDYTAFHRLSFRDKVSVRGKGLMEGRREGRKGGGGEREAEQAHVVLDETCVGRVSLCVCMSVCGWVVPWPGHPNKKWGAVSSFVPPSPAASNGTICLNRPKRYFRPFYPFGFILSSRLSNVNKCFCE